MTIKTTRLHESITNQIFKTHFINYFKNNLEEMEKYHYEELVKYSNVKYLHFEERYNNNEYLKKLKETFLRINDNEIKYVINHDQFTRLCDAAINGTFQNTVDTITNEIYMLRNKLLSDNIPEKQKEINDDIDDKDSVEEHDKTTKKKAFKVFDKLMVEDKSDQATKEPKKEKSSSEATVAYQPAVANNLFGNTGVTNQISFSPASDFRTIEERISELFTRLMMETDRNKILYIVNQIINLVPDKEAFKKTLLSKLKGM